jgi:hypothetical protein
MKEAVESHNMTLLVLLAIMLDPIYSTRITGLSSIHP